MVAGFPGSRAMQNGLNVSVGNISALAGPGRNTALTQFTARLQDGNSGGPLLDEGGNLVGVVVNKLDKRSFGEAIGDIPENLNFAVQGPVARLFLEAGGQRVTERSTTRNLRIGDIIDRAREFTFQIECAR